MILHVDVDICVPILKIGCYCCCYCYAHELYMVRLLHSYCRNFAWKYDLEQLLRIPEIRVKINKMKVNTRSISILLSVEYFDCL